MSEIQRAAERLLGTLVPTPLVPLDGTGADDTVLLKPEILQVVGSFKIRGVFNAVASLSAEQRATGLSTVSAGNTAQALAWAGAHFGVPARSLMPDTAPAAKIEAVERLGGQPVLVPVDELFRFLRERGWEQQPYAFIHPWTNRDVMIGHGTLGLEILAEAPEVDTVFIPVGGGGLMGGVGAALRALRPSVRLVAVEPEGCPALAESLERGEPATVDCDTICDGVAVPYITEEMYPLLAELVDEVVLVADDTVRDAMRRLVTGNRMIVESSGALSVAAARATPPAERGTTVCLLTGGSIDPGKLVELL